MSTPWPPIKTGTRVKVAVLRSGKGDYTEEAIQERARHNGKTGIVGKHSDSHGLCYQVTFTEGEAWFDPEELEIVS